ncbi:MAG: MraY family glycosyltransferase [Patescibacteria group bacterium]
MSNWIVVFVTAVLASFLSTPLVIKFAWKAGLIDDPKKNKHIKVIHTVPTPRAGGLALFIGVILPALIFLPLDKHLIGILVGAIILVVMGLADDKWNLNPYLRLGIQFAAVSIPIAAGIGIAFVTNPLTGGIIDLSHPQIVFNLFGDQKSIWVLSDLFALVWIVTLMNFINFGAKGVDGQLPGVITIAAFAVAIISLGFSADITQWPVIILALITAGSFLGFLPWNAYPQKIMPGFGGSNLAGYLLAILSILATAKVGTLAVVLAVPLIDTGYVLIRRIASGESPVWGDRRHLHHKLLDLGWSKLQVSGFYWAITFVLAILAINLNAKNKLYTIVGVAVALAGFLLWVTNKNNLKALHIKYKLNKK